MKRSGPPAGGWGELPAGGMVAGARTGCVNSACGGVAPPESPFALAQAATIQYNGADARSVPATTCRRSLSEHGRVGTIHPTHRDR